MDSAIPCYAPDCNKVAVSSCARCRTVAYCSAECQKADWKTHKPNCKSDQPAFTNSLTKKQTATFLIGTKMDQVGGRRPLAVEITKFNPPGMGRPNDSSARGLATYSVKTIGQDPEETWDEPCEDMHDRNSWKLRL